MNIRLPLVQVPGQAVRTDPSLQRLPLKIGEPVQATLVEQLSDGSAVLRIKGETVRAQLEAPLPNGSTIPLVVIGYRENGVWELKVNLFASQRAEEAGAGFSTPGAEQAETQLLSRLLQNLGLHDTPLTRQIASSLLRAGQPVTASLVTVMERLVVQAGEDMSRQASAAGADIPAAENGAVNGRLTEWIDTLTAMVRRNIPLSLATWQAVKTLWHGPPLAGLLSEAAAGTRFSADDDPSVQPKAEAHTQAHSPGKADAAVGKGSASETDARFAASHATANRPDAPQVPRGATTDPLPAGERMMNPRQGFPFADLLLKLESFARLSPQERASAIQSLVSRLGLDHEFQLALWQKTGSGTVPPETLKSAVLAQWLANPEDTVAAQILHHLTGQQLMHSQKEDASPFLYHYVSLPMSIGQQPADAKVHVLTRKQPGKRLDPSNCYLYFQLRLPTIGELGVHVQIIERLVSVRLIAEPDRPIELDPEGVTMLRDGLQQAGYQLGTVRQEAGGGNPNDPFAQLVGPIGSGIFDWRA